MSFDGVLVNKLISEFQILKSGRITKVSESGNTDFVLTIRAERKNIFLLLSFSSDFARIHIANKFYDAPSTPKGFTMLLRKHLEGAFILDIYQYELDRIIVFKIGGYNDMKDYSEKYLICEVMGRYSNLIITEGNYQIIDSLKHDHVGEYNRTILPNATYEFPKTDKLNPITKTEAELVDIFKEKNILTPKDVMNTFLGVSLNISYPIFLKNNPASEFYSYLHNKLNPATFINQKNKTDFYFTNEPFPLIKSYETISDLLENYYYDADKSAKIKQKTANIELFIEKQIKKNKDKIVKLNRELLDAKNSDEFRIFGELLQANAFITQKLDKITVLNYYTNENVIIPLDPLLSIIENSQKYFKKYRKGKNACSHLEEQISIANDEIEYFTLLLAQVKISNLNDILEIQEELRESNYLRTSSKPLKKKKPKLLCYEIEPDVLVYVGKNNIQNDYLTNKFAMPNELWFHVKDAPGSHVLLRTTKEITDDMIRITANIASYYSYFQDSSSVPVNYTLARYIKKIPGKRNCFVSISHQKTIYIDPNKDQIEQLKVIK